MAKIKKEASKRTPAPQSQDGDRRGALLSAAARLFGRDGYHATSVRDIAREVGILSGSIYYHVASKEDLLLAVHEAGVKRILQAVRDAVSRTTLKAWDRLEAACVAHVTALLDSKEFGAIVTPQFISTLPKSLWKPVTKQRRDYEDIFRELIDELPLLDVVQRRYLRLSLLGSLNWTQTWYHPGGDTPPVIAKRIVQLYRWPLDPPTPQQSLVRGQVGRFQE
jgi:TetR/AcrR family transcriptional regulator, cholesterol catabolism regulator